MEYVPRNPQTTSRKSFANDSAVNTHVTTAQVKKEELASTVYNPRLAPSRSHASPSPGRQPLSVPDSLPCFRGFIIQARIPAHIGFLYSTHCLQDPCAQLLHCLPTETQPSFLSTFQQIWRQTRHQLCTPRVRSLAGDRRWGGKTANTRGGHDHFVGTEEEKLCLSFPKL